MNYLSGHPWKLTPQKCHYIGTIIKHNQFTTTPELKAKLEENDPELEVSERTIRRELTNLGFVSVLPRRVPLLTQQAKDRRLSWAHDHARYNWKKVVFFWRNNDSDVSYTLLTWSRNAKPVAPMVKHPFKVHVWAAISTKGKVMMYLSVYRKSGPPFVTQNSSSNALYDNIWAKTHLKWCSSALLKHS